MIQQCSAILRKKKQKQKERNKERKETRPGPEHLLILENTEQRGFTALIATATWPCLVQKKILQYPSHQMFRHIHGVLNAVEKNN